MLLLDARGRIIVLRKQVLKMSSSSRDINTLNLIDTAWSMLCFVLLFLIPPLSAMAAQVPDGPQTIIFWATGILFLLTLLLFGANLLHRYLEQSNRTNDDGWKGHLQKYLTPFGKRNHIFLIVFWIVAAVLFSWFAVVVSGEPSTSAPAVVPAEPTFTEKTPSELMDLIAEEKIGSERKALQYIGSQIAVSGFVQKSLRIEPTGDIPSWLVLVGVEWDDSGEHVTKTVRLYMAPHKGRTIQAGKSITERGIILNIRKEVMVVTDGKY